MTPELRKHCQARKTAMLAERQPWEADWRTVAEYIDPDAGDHLQPEGKQGKRSRGKIINSHATQCLGVMDAGFMGGHTSKSRPWFRITVPDPLLAQQAAVKAWCDDVAQGIRDVLAKSNFYTALPVFYHQRHMFGIAALACDVDPVETVRFYARPIGTYACALDSRGLVDSFWYTYRRKARQLEQTFGRDKLPRKVIEALDNNRGDTEFTVESLIEPNPDGKSGVQTAPRRPFRQVHWIDGAETDDHGCLQVEGHYDNPVKVSRWSASGNRVYSPSPSLNALGDIKQLQYLEGKKLKLFDLASDPPMGLPDFMRGKAASFEPGSKTYITPMQTQQEVKALFSPDPRAIMQAQAEIDKVAMRIERVFYNDLFRMLDFLDDRQRTAYEISERKEEKIAMLGPALESLTDEVLDPIIGRVYGVMERAGLIPEPPQELDGVPVSIEYTSMLAQAQKASGIGTIERTIGYVANLFSATGGSRPELFDKLDLDESIDVYADQMGAPARIVRSDDDVAQIRADRAQQAQMQQMAQMAPAMKQGADAMKTLAEAVPKDGSVGEAIAGGLAA